MRCNHERRAGEILEEWMASSRRVFLDAGLQDREIRRNAVLPDVR